MPRVRPLGKPDYDKIFCAELDCAITRSFLNKQEVADRTGITKRMLYNKLGSTQSISLVWLKMFVKVTGMNPNVILEYLYEGKYKVQEKEDKR